MDNTEIRVQDGDSLKFNYQNADPMRGRPQPQWTIIVNDIEVGTSTEGDFTVKGNGKNVSIEIPPTIGLNKTDRIPSLSLETPEPIVVTGGDFVLTRGTAQVYANPSDINAPTLNNGSLINGSDIRFEKNSKSIGVQRNDGRTHTVTVERGRAEIGFIQWNKEEKKNDVIFTLSGEKSFAVTEHTYEKMVENIPAAGQVDNPRQVDSAERLNSADFLSVSKTLRETNKQLDSLLTSSAFSEFRRNNPDIVSQIKGARKTSDNVLRDDVTIDKEQLNKLNNTLDNIAEKSKSLSWDKADPAFTNAIGKIQDNLKASSALQISAAPSADVLEQALAVVSPELKGSAPYQESDQNSVQLAAIQNIKDSGQSRS